MKISDFRLGQGTWTMGEDARHAGAEIEALRFGIDHGLVLIDTAEMYASGGAERVVGEAIAPYARESLYLVSKVYPHNASMERMQRSCVATLERLGTDYLDCYLLHWRGSIPLRETVQAFEALLAEGLIRSWGVSNFDVDDMEELLRLPGGEQCATNQVLYNVAVRGIEYDLLPWQEARSMPLMAYTPFVLGSDWQRRIGENAALQEVAGRHNATVRQILLAFVMRRAGVAAIPKAGNVAHVAENLASLQIVLTEEDLAAIDRAFPPPTHKSPLQSG